ncbi:MAG: 30S ribosomal protein S12 methylthiotransferase RimO [Acidobacteriota bacterium]
MAKVGFVSLGCPKNRVDTEVMLGLLAGSGHEISPRREEAEIIVVNTCGFIESARQESVDTILEMAQQKVWGKCRRLIVAGCLVERYRREIRKEIPEVDAVIGTHEIPRILELCGNLDLQTTPPPSYEPRELYLYSDSDPRILTTPSHLAYIKIAEGCDHPCTFCVIPQMRGRFRSRPLDSVIVEAERLAAQGVKELILVGQDTTMYGWDHGNRQGLAQLIRKLGAVDGIEWVRFLYAYPNHVYPELLDAIAETEKACNYIDVPIQHVSSPVLKGMKRGGNPRTLNRLISKIRDRVPGVAIRTTLIVGFPGETHEDFEALVEFVEAARFDRLGVFTYSDEEHAASRELGGKVREEVKLERQSRLMGLQSEISREKNHDLLGKTVPVMLEGVSEESELLWQGRLSTQAPEIDGVVYLTDGVTKDTRTGEIRQVRIIESHDYDLVGEVVA